jgi:hypothetical protein
MAPACCTPSEARAAGTLLLQLDEQAEGTEATKQSLLVRAPAVCRAQKSNAYLRVS